MTVRPLLVDRAPFVGTAMAANPSFDILPSYTLANDHLPSPSVDVAKPPFFPPRRFLTQANPSRDPLGPENSILRANPSCRFCR